MTASRANEEAASRRLFSLDVLRGLCMIAMTVFGPLVFAAQSAFQCFPPAFMAQFEHQLRGYSFWDVIMPMFIFMCGAAIPFALGRRLKEGKSAFWRHVLVRVALLWVLGGLVQGHWARLDLQVFSPFSNALQAIAVGYLATAAMMLVPSRTFRIVCPVALSVAYAAILAADGDYSPTGNLAVRIDQAMFSAILPATNACVAKPSVYAWFLPSMMFAAMTMCGYHATMILKSGWTARRKTAALLAYAAGLFAAGGVASVWIPLYKPIFTFSFTAFAMGWSVLTLSALYVVCDVWRFRRGMALALLFGQHALAAYFFSQFFRHRLFVVTEALLSPAAGPCGPNVVQFLADVGVVLEVVVFVVLWRQFMLRRPHVPCGDIKCEPEG